MAEPAAPRPIPAPERLPWLESAWTRLCRARAADRLPHALLIVGPRGVGKRSLAELLARSLVCELPQADGTHCGRCGACRQSAAGSHPDLVRVGPDPESKSGEIGIDAIRSLSERAALTAGPAAYRPVLIDPADRLSAPAANALLKTLEEPPAAVVICLIAEQLGRLPATVRSRCQQVPVAVPAGPEALAWLAARLPAGEDPEQRLALARGAPLRALGEVHGETFKTARSLLASLAAIGRGERDPVTEATAWNAPGARLSLDWLAGWLGDLARLQAERTLEHTPPGAAGRPTAASGGEALAALLPGLDPAALHRLLRRVLEARGLTETNLIPLLLLESLLIEWAQVTRRGGS